MTGEREAWERSTDLEPVLHSDSVSAQPESRAHESRRFWEACYCTWIQIPTYPREYEKWGGDAQCLVEIMKNAELWPLPEPCQVSDLLCVPADSSSPSTSNET